MNYSTGSIDRSKLHEVILNILKLVSCDRNYSENFNVYVTNKKPEVRFYTYGQNGWEQNGNLDTIKKINKIMLDEFLSVIQNYYMKTETDPQKLMIAKKLMEVINQDENIKFTQNIKQSNSYYFESRKNLLPSAPLHPPVQHHPRPDTRYRPARFQIKAVHALRRRGARSPSSSPATPASLPRVPTYKN